MGYRQYDLRRIGEVRSMVADIQDRHAEFLSCVRIGARGAAADAAAELSGALAAFRDWSVEQDRKVSQIVERLKGSEDRRYEGLERQSD